MPDKKESKTSTDAEAPKRGRGRPRKNPADPIEAAPAEPKRGRGRPRKNPAAEQVEAAEPKRGRGRPRKNPEPVATPAPEVEEPRRSRGRPRKDNDVVEPVAASAAPQAKEPTSKPPSQSKRGGSNRGRKPAATYTVPTDFDDPRDPLPVPVFRPIARKEKPQAPKPVVATSETSEIESTEPEIKISTRRVKPRRGTQQDGPKHQEAKQHDSDKSEDSKSKQRPAKPEPKPEPAMIELIRVPSDAPQVVMRDGIPTLVRDARVFPPIFFFANAPEETRLEIVREEMRMAAESGVHVFVHYVDFEVDPAAVSDAVGFAGYLLRETIKIDPQAQVLFRLAFLAPVGWETKYPRARYTLEGGGIGEPSVCDDAYWQVAEDCLQEFISQIRMLPESNQVLGLHLERGEWFHSPGSGYDTSASAQDAFRLWARKRYGNDSVALCASWFDGQAQFETIAVPEYTHDGRAGEEFVRTGRKTRRWVDYHLFLSDIMVDRIGKLAHATKKASEGYFLVGVSYGYTFEWSHPGNGHLSLGKLLRNPEVDFIAGPPSYKNREPGGSAPFPCPIDSFALNGKLYVSEEDFKTPISGRQEPDDFNPIMKTPQALDNVHWRGFGAAAAHRSGVCWMDLWGNGWLKTPGIWDRAHQIRSALIHRMASPTSDPDIAVLIDERSLAYLVDHRAFELLVQQVRESVLRSGLSAGFYLLSDLAHREHFPESKVVVFVNAWDVRPEVRSAIKARLHRDGKVLFWLYAAGLFDSGRDAMERVREITGIAIKRQPFASQSGTSIIHRKHPLGEALPEKVLSGGSALEPSYFAIPEEDSVILGEYSSTGLPSFLMRDFRNEDGQKWTSVFLGEAVVTPALFRNLGIMAGAHVWNHQEDLVHAQQPFVTIHCKGAGIRTITLPDKWQAYNLQTGVWMPTDGNQVRFQATDGSTHAFLAGLKGEIEAILNRPEDDLLKIEALPDRPSNTLRLDDIHFDVPIMKLDEWVEDSWNEEISDDFILRPSQIDLELPDSTEEAGARGDNSRQRGRRRQRRRNDRGRETGGSKDFDVMEMNVVFRKRE